MTFSFNVGHSVKAPYSLSWEEMNLEPRPEAHPEYDSSQLVEALASYREEEMERVFLSISLLRIKFPTADLSHIIETAMVWERG